MATKKFGKLIIDPSKNPAILDTETWDADNASLILSSLESSYWGRLVRFVENQDHIPVSEHIVLFPGSFCRYRGRSYLLAKFKDGQRGILEIGQRTEILGKPLWVLADTVNLAAYETDATRVDAYFRNINPEKGPRSLGAVPRLGIGTRMSRWVWPGTWEAMENCGFSANAIQNSLRELNLLDEILTGQAPKTNYLFGFGNIQEGHTGSTFEGLWLSGVLEALSAESFPRYGADADHIQVKRGPGGIGRAKKVISASRYYSFYTLDVSDILNYQALNVSDATALELLTTAITDTQIRREVLLFHRRRRRLGIFVQELGEADIGRLVGKHWKALDAMEELYEHLTKLKNGQPFDLELSIDENPPEVNTFDSITTNRELLFLILEMERRNMQLTHVAPNLGVEKGIDYRGPDGLVGLSRRLRQLSDIASEYGLIVDCHSGDYLKEETRKVIGKATRGRNHFKISPALQVIFAEVLSKLQPEMFGFWWDDTFEYARREAEGGSQFATQCIKDYESAGSPAPAPDHPVFEHFHFATVGRRNDKGQFINRERFYSLSPSFYDEYRKQVKEYLCQLADDLFRY
ncbi:tagaturonate epimerase family protein [Chloroflexota bacterium]